MATLAKVRGILRELVPPSPSHEDEEEFRDELSTETAGKNGGVEGKGGAEEESNVESGENARGIDLGEVVRRQDVSGIEIEEGAVIGAKRSKKKKRGGEGLEEGAQREGEGEGEGAEATPAKRPKKKRKKGGDAFDDLFAGLI